MYPHLGKVKVDPGLPSNSLFTSATGDNFILSINLTSKYAPITWGSNKFCNLVGPAAFVNLSFIYYSIATCSGKWYSIKWFSLCNDILDSKKGQQGNLSVKLT